MRVDLARHGFVVHRPHRRPWLERVSEPDRVRLLDEPFEDGVVHLRVDEDPLARLADLAGVREAAERRAGDGELEVGVVKDDGRAVAPELEQHRLCARAACDRLPDTRTAGEADGVRPRARNDLAAHLGAAEDETDRAYWDARLEHALEQLHRDERRRRRRLPDDRVADCQAR